MTDIITAVQLDVPVCRSPGRALRHAGCDATDVADFLRRHAACGMRHGDSNIARCVIGTSLRPSASHKRS